MRTLVVSDLHLGMTTEADVLRRRDARERLLARLRDVERLAAGAMGRLVGGVPSPAATPDDYEALLAPIYAWIHATAQRAAPGRTAAGAGGAVRVYQLVSGGGRRPIGARVLAGLFPLAVAFVNRAGLGPVRANLAGPELRRSALKGMGEAASRLGVDAAHVVFGHSHRAGPLEGGDDPEEWVTADGMRLHNTGAWVFEDVFLVGHGPESGYWPGRAVALDDEGPPRLESLLADVDRDELRAPDAAPDEPGEE